MTETENPLHAGPRPPFPQQRQDRPETEREMQPPPDYGEDTYEGHGRLTGKAALITGGDSGIGRAVALAFAREGADVLISYYEADEDAEETVGLVTGAGRTGASVRGDVGEEAHCRELVGRALEELGHLDIVVNNAAYQMEYERFEDIPSDEIVRVFRTNVISMFFICQAAVPHLQPGASIINTTSIQATQPSPAILHYASTKGAVTTFTKGLAQELGARGIRVNAVAPGPVWTPLIPMSFDPDHTANFGKDTPFGRPAQPAELAPPYVFLASDESRFVNGAVIAVTGGKPL